MDNYAKFQAADALDRYGVRIIPRVIGADECEAMKRGMWKFLNDITRTWATPITEANPASWSGYSKLMPKHSMLLQNWKIGHAQFIWDLRQNGKIVDEFVKIWREKGYKDLDRNSMVVSFDGASFHFPPETIKKGWYRENDWLHVDQSYLRNDFECVQGWVNAFDTNEGDATLTLLEGSYRHHAAFRAEFGIEAKEDWFLLTDAQKKFYLDRGCTRVNIECRAGDLVLWDSRTVHAGIEPRKTRAAPNFRCCVYLCYSPKKLCTAAMLKKRKNAFDAMRTTNHWPHKCKLFSVLPRTYGAELPVVSDIDPPVLNDLGKSLVC